MYSSYHEYEEMATPMDACREYARTVGAMNPTQPWILTDYDTWQWNPFYEGPAVPHPEDDPYDEINEEMARVLIEQLGLESVSELLTSDNDDLLPEIEDCPF